MVCVEEGGGRLEAKDQAERWTGGGRGPWPGKVRLCGKSKAVEWSGGVVRCGAVRVRFQYGQMQMLRCAAQEGERLAGANSASLSLGV